MIRNKKYLLLGGAALFLLLCALVFISFMAYHHDKIMQGGGITFHDPVLKLFPGTDLSFFIFLITYGAVLSFVLLHLRQVEKLSWLMSGYGLLLLLRILSMTLVPLNEPPGLVRLEDPFLNELIYPGDITTDLFFSGHIGMLFLITFLSDYKYLYLTAGVILAVLLLFQHIHFSIDIIAAVPVAYLISRMVRKLLVLRQISQE